MSNAQPGWYPDPAGSGGVRWWTGRDWSAATGAPAGAPPLVVQPPLPPGTSTDTVWAYLQALLPLVSVLTTLPYLLTFQSFFSQITALQQQSLEQDDGGRAIAGSFGAIVVGGLVSALLGLLVYAAVVVLAFLDERELRRRGIVQPFPWPWSFLTLVYVIGRAVVVRRRTGGGLRPLWVFIAAYVGSIVLISVLSVVLFASLFTQMGTLTSQLPMT